MKDCCVRLENQQRRQLAPDKVVIVCSVCGCKHYGMRADPGRIGLRLAGLGR